MNLFKLVGSIFIDNEKANESLGKTDEKAGSVAQTLGKGIKTVAAWGTAIATAAVAAGTAIYNSATSAAAAADNIDKMSQKIGVSREAYQELDFICSQCGMSVDTLQTGVKTLTAAMDGAASGTASNVEQFEKLGVAVTNADGSFRSQEDVLFDTLTALQGMTDQTEKARLAAELFGRSGTELMPLLNGEAGSIEEMKQQAHELGLVLDDELIDNGVNLTDSLDQTKRALQAIAVNLGGSFMPIIEQISDYIQTFIPTISEMITGLSPTITQLLEGMLPSFMTIISEIFPQLISLFGALVPIFTDVVSTLLPEIVRIITMVLPVITQIISTVLPKVLEMLLPILDLIDPILDLLEPILDLIIALLDPIMMLLDAALPPLIAMLTNIITSLLPVLQTTISWLCSFLEEYVIPLIEAIVEVFIGPSLEELSQILGVFINGTITGIQGAIEIVTGIIDAFMSLLEGDFSGFLDGLGRIIAGFKNIALSIINTLFAGVIAFFQLHKAELTEQLNAIVVWVQGKIESAKESVLGKFEDVKEGIKAKLDAAFSVVKTVVDKIKELFNFTFTIPNIELPHFKINPNGWKLKDLLKGEIPTLGIDWYAKAMDDGMIMDKPTVFGINGNKLMAGGEAGSETVVGTQSLVKMIQDAVDNRIGSEMGTVIDLLLEMISLIQSETGDIILPIYLGTDMLDERIIRANEIQALRTGGR